MRFSCKRNIFKQHVLPAVLILVTLLSLIHFQSFSFATEGTGSIYVNGSKLYSPNGNELFMRGVNTLDVYYLRPEWDSYRDKHLDAIRIAAQKGVNAVRITWNIVDDKTYPELNKAAKLKELSRTLDFCRKLNLTVVLTLHYADYIRQLTESNQYKIDDEHKIDPTLLAHLQYLTTDAREVLNKNKDILILNFLNELGSFESPRTEWVVAQVYAITVLRNAGIKNCLVVNGANWGKEPESILKYGPYFLNIDPMHNICFDLHGYFFYKETPYLGNLETFEAMLDALQSRNLAIFYGEFANKNSDIDYPVDPAALFDIFNRKRIGYFAYVLYNNGPSMRHHNISEDFCQTFRDWGDLYLNHKRTIFDYIQDGAKGRDLYTIDEQDKFKYEDITKDILSSCPIYSSVGWTPREDSQDAKFDTQVSQQIPLVDYSKYSSSLHSIVLPFTSTTESQLNITPFVNTPTPTPTPSLEGIPTIDIQTNTFSDGLANIFDNVYDFVDSIGAKISGYVDKFQAYINT